MDDANVLYSNTLKEVKCQQQKFQFICKFSLSIERKIKWAGDIELHFLLSQN